MDAGKATVRGTQLLTRSALAVGLSSALLLGLLLGFFLGFLLGLALPPGAADRSAKDVAEAGTRIGRAEFRHRSLLFVHLARPDREGELAGGAVDRRYLGIDPLADSESIGTLLAAVARQLRLSDEAKHAITDRHLDPAISNRGYCSGENLTLLQLRHTGLEGVSGELLDPQADALFLDVDVEHLDAHHLTPVVIVDCFLSRTAPVDIGEVDHAVDFARQADEQAEFGDVADLALDLATNWMLFDEGLPWICERLLQAEAYPAFLRIHVEHHHLDFLTGRDNLAGMHVLLGPTHLGDMDEPFDPGLQLDEGAVVSNVGNTTAELGAGRIFEIYTLPRIGLELLHAERDALRLGIEANDLNLDGLADRQRLRRMVDAAPGNVGDMEQPVDATEIDESAVIGDVLDHAAEYLAFLQAGNELGALLGAALLEDGPARHHDVAARAVHLEDLERLRRPQQRGDVAHRSDIDLAARQKCDGAVEIDGKAAFYPAEDYAGHAVVRLKALIELSPGLLSARLLARKLGLPVLVLHALEIDFDDVADMQLGFGAPGDELLERYAAFRFEADIDQRNIVLQSDNPALDHSAFEAARDTERFIKKCRKTLLRGRLPGL